MYAGPGSPPALEPTSIGRSEHEPTANRRDGLLREQLGIRIHARRRRPARRRPLRDQQRLRRDGALRSRGSGNVHHPGAEYADHGDKGVPAHSTEAQRWVLPPGSTTVACFPTKDLHAVASPTATLEIADPQTLYVPISPDVECAGGRELNYEFVAPTHFATTMEVDATVRRELQGLRSDDVLQRGGYPDQPHVWVLILRGGAIVARVSFGPGFNSARMRQLLNQAPLTGRLGGLARTVRTFHGNLSRNDGTVVIPSKG
jgi:hypothetical protein